MDGSKSGPSVTLHLPSPVRLTFGEVSRCKLWPGLDSDLIRDSNRRITASFNACEWRVPTRTQVILIVTGVVVNPVLNFNGFNLLQMTIQHVTRP